MDPWFQIIITIITSVFASSGFWAFLQKRASKNDNKTKLLIGLAHDRICSLGEEYIEQGYITTDEYENLNDYLYAPYAESGGNGTAKKIMDEVKKLEIRPSHVE